MKKIQKRGNFNFVRKIFLIRIKMHILCAGGYNVSEKDVISDIINISFNINNDSKQVFNIEKQNIIKNAHNSWITGLLI